MGRYVYAGYAGYAGMLGCWDAGMLGCWDEEVGGLDCCGLLWIALVWVVITR